MLRSSSTPDGSSTYQLAAIIDWELAGFHPSSYQLSLQDAYLSGDNRRLSYYLLLKAGLREITPRSPSQISLLRAIELIIESRQRKLFSGRNIPAHILQRFREMLGLVRDEDPYIGWRRSNEGASVLDFTREDVQRLEDEVVADILGTQGT